MSRTGGRVVAFWAARAEAARVPAAMPNSLLVIAMMCAPLEDLITLWGGPGEGVAVFVAGDVGHGRIFRTADRTRCWRCGVGCVVFLGVFLIFINPEDLDVLGDGLGFGAGVGSFFGQAFGSEGEQGGE